MNEDKTTTKVATYGKRPLWQWGLIYLVVGGAIYAVIYYVISYRPASGYPQQAEQTKAAQTAAPAQPAPQPTLPSAAPAAPATQAQMPAPKYKW